MDHRLVATAIILSIAVAACGVSPTSAPASTEPDNTAAASAGASASLASATPALPRTGGTWTTGASTPSRRAENAAVALDGLIYLAGGLDIHGKTLDTFESYDPRTDTWTALPPLPAPRDHFGLAALGGKIYAVGGVVEGADPRALWAYDPRTDGWQTDLAPMPTEREHLTAVAADGLLIAIGGRKTHQIGAVEAYDPGTNTWRALPDLPTPRGGSAAGLLGDSIHVAGGENLNAMSTYAEHEVLDLAAMTWSKVAGT